MIICLKPGLGGGCCCCCCFDHNIYLGTFIKSNNAALNSFKMCQFVSISSTKCQQLYLTYEKNNTMILQLYICVGDSDVPWKPCLKDENGMMNGLRLIRSPFMLAVITHSLATAYQTSKGHVWKDSYAADHNYEFQLAFTPSLNIDRATCTYWPLTTEFVLFEVPVEFSWRHPITVVVPIVTQVAYNINGP